MNDKPILLNFDGAEMSSDAGLTLLRGVERRAGLVARCLTDRRDPSFKLALERDPETGAALCSQSTISRMEKLADTRALIRIAHEMVRFYCASLVDQRVFDTRRRSWDHLRFFEHKAIIHASVPRVACRECGKTRQVTVPWARSGSGFTQRIKAFVIAQVRAMPVKAVAELLDVGCDRIWRVVTHYVEGAPRAVAP